jgi:hypothetical protein
VIDLKRLTSEKWLIYSFEHASWWRPQRLGYTIHLGQAGKYSFEEALHIVTQANGEWGINEAMLPYTHHVENLLSGRL